MKTIILLVLCCVISSCGGEFYYKNVNPQKDNQPALDIDYAHCEAIAQQAKAGVQIPSYTPTPTGYSTSGNIIGFNDLGDHVMSGRYNSTTQYNYGSGDQLLQQSILLMQLSRADKIYESTKNDCLSKLGWYKISKEEYEREQAQYANKNQNTINQTKQIVPNPNTIENTLDITNKNGPYGPIFHPFTIKDKKDFIKRKVECGVSFTNKQDTIGLFFQLVRFVNNGSPLTVINGVKKAENVQNFILQGIHNGYRFTGTCSLPNCKLPIDYTIIRINNNEALAYYVIGNGKKMLDQMVKTIKY